MNIDGPSFVPTPAHIVELQRLGDEIAELSAHLDAATARLLDLIREFDARGGWNTGFLTCAAWLTWRARVGPRRPAGRRRPAPAPASPPPPAPALARGQVCPAKGPTGRPAVPPAAPATFPG